MLILFDHGTPIGLARALPEHTVHTAQARFEVLVTTDRRIRYQQNLRGRRIALVVLTGTTKWSRVRQHTDRVAVAVASATAGSYSEVDIPFELKARHP